MLPSNSTQLFAKSLSQTAALLGGVGVVLLMLLSEQLLQPASAQTTEPESTSPAETAPKPVSNESDSTQPISVPFNTRSSIGNRNNSNTFTPGACSETVTVKIKKDDGPESASIPAEIAAAADVTSVSIPAVTDRTICQPRPTLPSFWLASALEESRLRVRLLTSWKAYPDPDPTQEGETPRVDLFVNPQLWSVLDYLDRYEAVNRFGLAARKYGYNAFVFSQQSNQQSNALASYTCDFAAAAAASPSSETPSSAQSQKISCRIEFNSFGGRGGFRGGSTSPLGGF